MDLLQIMIFLIILFIITFFILILYFFCEILHINQKQYIIMCILSTFMFLHKMMIEFKYMYITYAILVLAWIVFLIYEGIHLLKEKKFLQILLISLILIISILFPAFGKLRTYYLYKPIYLFRSYSILNNGHDLPFLSSMTGSNVYVLNNNVYYELGGLYAMDQTGGIVITFDSTPSKKDWDQYISFEKIDHNAYFYIREK